VRRVQPGSDPRAEYSARLQAAGTLQSRQDRHHKQFGLAKLGVAVVCVIIVIFALTSRMSILWIAIPVAVFVYLSILHESTIQTIRRNARIVNFYERGLARLDGRWMGAGETGERYLDESHPYARDLDLFGRGALFDLLCTARTRSGEECLANWLLAPAPPEEVQKRQAAVDELRGRLDLREDLAVLGEDIRAGEPPEVLAAWGEGERILKSGWVRIALPGLVLLWLLSLAVWAVWGVWSLAVFLALVNVGVARRFVVRLEKVVGPVEKLAHDLALLSEVLGRLEREQFAAPKLLALQAAFHSQAHTGADAPHSNQVKPARTFVVGDYLKGLAPSQAMSRLNRLVGSLESRRHRLVEIIDPVIFWTLQLGFAIESWREKFGPSVRRWLATLGELEALSALAGYAYEHPADVFPEFTSEEPCFDAEAFAHPLLPESQAVRNDLKLGGEIRLLIISGPNMAGKSTFVRSVGINAVLAQCGAPVRARRLRLSPLAVTASICILDSLQGGVSHFYAEILRLKQIMNLTSGPLPVLFLLDELLSGTNSHDRRVGAAMIVKNLVGRGAIGMITTHDLALTQITESMGTRAANFHFEDRLENGKLRFDFRLTPGIVQTSNALELMRSIGLEEESVIPEPL